MAAIVTCSMSGVSTVAGSGPSDHRFRHTFYTRLVVSPHLGLIKEALTWLNQAAIWGSWMPRDISQTAALPACFWFVVRGRDKSPRATDSVLWGYSRRAAGDCPQESPSPLVQTLYVTKSACSSMSVLGSEIFSQRCFAEALSNWCAKGLVGDSEWITFAKAEQDESGHFCGFHDWARQVTKCVISYCRAGRQLSLSLPRRTAPRLARGCCQAIRP